MRLFIIGFIFLFFTGCRNDKIIATENDESEKDTAVQVKLDLQEANRLSELAKKCIQTPLPYKAGHVIAKAEDLDMPQIHHPAFYGCFDWHSAVHGHWSLVYLLKTFPELNDSDSIRLIIDKNLTEKNIQTELRYFEMNDYTKSFERTYGWAWLLKLAEELYTWEDPQSKIWLSNLQPLCDYIAQQYVDYLPKLVYPIRVGEHSNTAFGLSFAYDYAKTTNHRQLISSVEEHALSFYHTDEACPIAWEPSGYDFLSPCLQEADIMRKVLSADDFNIWLQKFLPQLADGSLNLEPGKVIDRSDGKLVHLDGLNFSRAWCLYPMSGIDQNIRKLADEHMVYSLSKITDGDYMGEHWLASFALYAFKSKEAFKL